MSDIYEKIGQKIRKLRQEYPKGPLSQEALAKQLGVPPNTLSRWETGKYKPTAANLDQLARFFQVSITVFFPDRKISRNRVAALTSATGGLSKKDFNEVVRYADFRRLRKDLESPKKKRKTQRK